MRVGQRIREVVEIVEKLGPSKYNEVYPLLPHIERSNVGKYCSRAVGLRLMTVDRTVSPFVYAAVPDWREVARAKGRAREQKTAVVHRPRPCSLQQAWGAMA